MTQLSNFLLKIWHKFEDWGNDVARAQVERYLSQSQNIFELEERMRDIERVKTRYIHYI